MKIKIAPAIMDSDLGHLADQIAMIEAAGADALHMDIMDGHYVPAFVGGPRVLRAVKRYATVPVDVHLMVTNPDTAVDWFIDAGADLLFFHHDATEAPGALLARIHEAGRLGGVALSPDVPADVVAPYAGDLDAVVVMTVYPGFSGQKFIESACGRIPALRALCRDDIDVYVDGGIGPDTAAVAVRYGANVLAAASAVFAADVPPAEALARLRRAGESGTATAS